MSRLTLVEWAMMVPAVTGWLTAQEPSASPDHRVPPPAIALEFPSIAPSTFQFHAERLAMGAHRYEMVMSVRGEEQTIGSSDAILARVGESVRFVAINEAPSFSLSERIEVLLNASSLAVQSHVADMTYGLFQGHTSVSFAAGRAKGRVQQPTAQGLRTINVDIAVEDDVTDDAIAMLLLATADLDVGMTGTYRAFRASTGRIETIRVRIAGRETISVPAGKFEVFRIEQNGVRSASFVTTAEPRTLVALHVGGASSPLEMDLRLVR